MKFSYYADTDSLYIDLSSSDSVNSVGISDGVVVDYGAELKIQVFDKRVTVR